MQDSKTKESKTDTPFQRFEELTKRLLAVPKEEADAKAKELKRRRKSSKRR
jgi:hypothetical protein